MESVHKPETRDWIGELVDVKEFRNQWTSSLAQFVDFDDSTLESKLMRELNITSEEFQECEKRCSAAAFRCPFEEEVEIAPSKFTIPEGVTLETVKSQKEDRDKRDSDPSYKVFLYNNHKYVNYPPSKVMANMCGATELSSNRATLPDVILTVQIYRPDKAMKRYTRKMVSRFPAFAVEQELCVIGNQPLTDLRDKIYCVSDLAVPGDFSENPKAECSISEKTPGNSGFFYINGVFYNDMRDEQNKDYSSRIIEWSKELGSGIGPFESQIMETTKFVNLKIQLGYPYVYVHHGNCEHLLVFNDLRMLNDTDNLNRNEYPLVHRFIPKKPTHCMVCHCYTPKWVVTKNKRLPEATYLFCDQCFYSFNYDENDKKIGSFEARKYFDRTLLF